MPELTARASAWRQTGTLTTIADHRTFVREAAGASDATPLLFLH